MTLPLYLYFSLVTALHRFVLIQQLLFRGF